MKHAWWLFAIVAAYLYVFPYFPATHSANELPRVFLVRAIVDEHRFAIEDQMERFHEQGLADVSPWDVHMYSNKAPGSSLLVVPVYAAVRLFGDPSLGQTVWLCRVVGGVIPAALFLWLLWGFLARFAPEPETRRLVVVAYGLGSMAMTFALLFFSHQLAAVCIASAWILGLDTGDRRRGMLWWVMAGALAGAAPLVDYQAAFAGVPVAIHVLARIRAWPRRDLVRAIVLAAAGASVPIAMLLAYHALCFGSPLRTGYDASVNFAQFHQQGFLGMTRPHLDALWGTLFAADNGLVVLMPWLLFAVPGGVILWRRGERGVVLVAGSVAVMFLLFVISLTFWRSGWSVGPRYITALLPFELPLVAAAIAWLRTRPLVLGAAAGTMVLSVVIYCASAATFICWPDSLHDPLVDCTLRLLGDNVVAPNALGMACGIRGLVTILPYAAATLGLTGWAIARAAGWRGLLVAAGVGAALVGAFWLVPHGGPDADFRYTQRIRPAVMQAW